MSYTYALQGKKPGELSKSISMHISEVKEDPKLNSEQKEAQIARLEDFGQKLVDWSRCRRITLWSST